MGAVAQGTGTKYMGVQQTCQGYRAKGIGNLATHTPKLIDSPKQNVRRSGEWRNRRLNLQRSRKEEARVS